jgi:hypothetical protein
MGRFTSPDAPFADQDTIDPRSWNLYAYTRNNPLKYIDRNGDIIETAWDAFNVVLGAKSFVSNVVAGNYLSATVDAVGVVVDAAAVLVPAAPGGAGTAIRAARTAGKVAAKADDVIDAARAGGNGLIPTARGRVSEKVVLEAEGLAKNTKAFEAVDPKTGKLGATIPDSIRQTGQTVEIKDAKRVTDSAQLRLQSQVSGAAGEIGQVITGTNTKVSKTVQRRMEVRRRSELGPDEQ